MANIHLSGSGNANLHFGNNGSNGGDVGLADSTMPKYVGARAVVTRTADGVVIWMKDYKGETTETIAEAISGITTNADGSLTFTLSNGQTLTTGSLKGDKGDTGDQGEPGETGADGYSPSATVSKVGTTATITITDKDGTTTAQIHDGGASAFEAEFNVTTYADVKDAYDNDAILICTADDSGNPMVLQFVYFDVANEIFYFAFPMSDGWYLTQLSNADGWDDGYFRFASTDVATQLADGLMSALDKQKLDAIAAGAEVNVQSDWSQSVNTADDFIKNKPTNVSSFVNDVGYITGMTILSYGTSTWQDFITAYNANKVVYCRASSNSNPATGSQTRLAFMAYVNNATNPTEVEFQYYRSVNTHSDSQQGDQVYVYKITSAGTWSVTTREAYTKMVAGSGLSSTYSNGKLTLSADVQSESDPVFSASAASGISSSDITSWNGKQEALVSGTNIKTINNTSILGSGDITVAAGGTSIPTADTVAEFDGDAHINSEDMSSQDVSDFVDGLEARGESITDCDLLFSGSLQYGGTAQLSKNITNYRKLMIVAHDSDGAYKTFDLITDYANSTVTYLDFNRFYSMWYMKAAVVTIVDTTITMVGCGQAYLSSQQLGNFVTVDKVYGCKYLVGGKL